VISTPHAGGADLLTRTTLHLGGNPSTLSVAQMIRALQRVPGVLLAEINAADARAIVAHDAAVPGASLVAAAARAGINAAIVSNTPMPSMSVNAGSAVNTIRARRLVIGAVEAFVVLSSMNALLPKSNENHWLLAVLLSTTWLLFLASMIVRKKA